MRSTAPPPRSSTPSGATSRLRMTAVAGLVLALTLAPVVLSATVATAAEPPPAPTYAEGNDYDLVEGEGLTVEGSAEPGAVVNLTLGGTQLCGDIGVNSGTWSCTVNPLPYDPGEYTLSATQTLEGATSAASTATVTVTAAEGEEQPLSGREVLDCAFSPGALSVTSTTPGVTVNLYRVDPPGDESYSADNLGLCSGDAGAANPGPFGDTPFGDCSANGGGEGGEEGEGGEGAPGGPTLSGDPATGCVVSGLTPGMWNLYYFENGEGATTWDWFFIVPEAPSSLAAGEPVPGTAAFSSSGTTGNTITVVDGANAVVCTSPVVANQWACSREVGAATTVYRAFETDASSGGTSPFGTGVSLTTTAPVFLTVPPSPLAGAPAAPRPSPGTVVTSTRVPFSWTLVMTGVNGPLRPGQYVGLSSSGIPAGSTVDAELRSTPRQLGSTTVKADGTFDFRVRIPLDAEPGEHRIVVTVTAPGEEPSPIGNPVAIELEPESEPGKSGELISKDDPRLAGVNQSAPVLSRDDPAAPTALTGALPTLFDVLTSPAVVAISAGLALVILLLVAIPAEVLNATIESNTSRFGRTFARIEAAINRATEWFVTVTRTPAVAALVLIVITSIIFGFVDPAFGFDIASVRLVLSLAIALFIVTFVASRLTGAIVGRAWSIRSSIGFQPTALLFAILGVIVARLLDFSPGFLIGLVLGLELSHRADELHRVRALVIEFGLIVGFGVLSWLGYSFAVAVTAGSEPTFLSALVQDTLVAVTSEGLTAVVIALVPVAFLDGKKIFDRSKRLWAGMFLVAATAFSLLVLPTALAGQEIEDVAVWVAVLAGFAALAFGVTWWLRRTGRNPASQERAKAHDSVA